MEKENVLFVGVDLHKSQFTTHAILNREEHVVFKEVFYTSGTGYDLFKEKLHKAEDEMECIVRIAIETTGNARYFKNVMEREGFEVVVVNTCAFKVISTSTKKNDANDAETLANFLSKDMLPVAYLCDQKSEELRRLIHLRTTLVRNVVNVKNEIHGMMLSYGVNTVSAQLQSEKKRQALLEIIEQSNFSQCAVRTYKRMLSIIDTCVKEINDIEADIREIVKEDTNVSLLMTIPGIGIIVAATIGSYMKDLSRFENNYKKFAAYIGIVPSVHNSNKTEHLGRITKRGPQELRTAFVQAAMGMIRLKKYTGAWRLMIDYELRKSTKGTGKAIIALARKISRIAFSMVSSNQQFDRSKMERKKMEEIIPQIC